MSNSETSFPPGREASRASQYWLALSAIFGLALEVAVFAERAWLWLFVSVFALALYGLARHFGQVDAWVRGRSMPGWLSGLTFMFGLAAFQLHGNEAAGWIGTGLSVLGFAVMLALLNRFGTFQRPVESTNEGTE
ncbi:hypothetical protein [Sinomonas albida]|uniref:hypothetical protein n=1 Tax=Sinomonas albida TaxID=369942 RepID=UPI0030196210